MKNEDESELGKNILRALHVNVMNNIRSEKDQKYNPVLLISCEGAIM